MVHAGVVELGWIGELHPLITRAWDLEGGAAFELDFDALAAAAPEVEQFADVTSFPAVRQDIAVVTPAGVEAEAIRLTVLEAGGELLTGAARVRRVRGRAGGGGQPLAGAGAGVPRARPDPDRRGGGGPAGRDRGGAGREGMVTPCIGSPSSEPPATAARWAPGIVHRHPGLELTAVTARSDAGRRHDELYPIHRIGLVMDEFDPDRIAEAADSALVAYPHKAAAGAVRELRARGLKVVDFSADFRLAQDAYEHWYQPHEAPELLGEAVYGLPEINGHRDQIREAELVAGPGCNSTAALLGLWPLREHLRDAIVDIKTGVSGAGREATQETHYVSASDNVNAYKTEGHRHQAELEQELPDGIGITFVPHLIPVDQGLLATNYALRPTAT